jgi:hypothetical protein
MSNAVIETDLGDAVQVSDTVNVPAGGHLQLLWRFVLLRHAMKTVKPHDFTENGVLVFLSVASCPAWSAQ